MNAAEGLAREIRRVAELKCDYEKLADMPNVMVGPAIMMMEVALEKACIAAGTNDALAVLRSYEDLRGFER